MGRYNPWVKKGNATRRNMIRTALQIEEPLPPYLQDLFSFWIECEDLDEIECRAICHNVDYWIGVMIDPENAEPNATY